MRKRAENRAVNRSFGKRRVRPLVALGLAGLSGIKMILTIGSFDDLDALFAFFDAKAFGRRFVGF